MSDVRWRIELVKAGLLGLWKNDLKEKEKVTAIVNIHFIQSPLLFNPEKRRGKIFDFLPFCSAFSEHQDYYSADY